MTILFTGSKNGDRTNYQRIVKCVESLGLHVKVRTTLTDKKSVKTKFKSEIQNCDFVIADVTDPSLSVGLEIATAVSKNTHVLILSSNPKSIDDISDFLRESSSRYTHIANYQEQDLEKVLSENIKKIKKQLHYVLYVELPNKYGDMILDIQKLTKKSKKQIVQEALIEYLHDESQS